VHRDATPDISLHRPTVACHGSCGEDNSRARRAVARKLERRASAMIRRESAPTDPEAMRESYPIEGKLPNWYFRLRETSNNARIAEGWELLRTLFATSPALRNAATAIEGPPPWWLPGDATAIALATTVFVENGFAQVGPGARMPDLRRVLA
jgi:hypothetical protein